MSIFLERLALLSALSAIVLSVLWTHIRRKVWYILDTLSAYPPLSVLLMARGRSDWDSEHLASKQDVIIQKHPKFTDLSFRRRTTTSEVSKNSTSEQDMCKEIVFTGNMDYKLCPSKSVGVLGTQNERERERKKEQNSDGIWNKS